MSFWCFKCKSCGSWQSREVRDDYLNDKVFKCFCCNKSTTINLKRKKDAYLNLDHYGPFSNPREATAVILALKERTATNNGELFKAELNEFSSYSRSN